MHPWLPAALQGACVELMCGGPRVGPTATAVRCPGSRATAARSPKVKRHHGPLPRAKRHRGPLRKGQEAPRSENDPERTSSG